MAAATMEAMAFLSRPRRHSTSDEPALHGTLHYAGQEVQITRGALAGMEGSIVKQSEDGRWIVRLANVAAGVLLCIDDEHLQSR
jgi:hypothetical protein